MTSSTTNSSDPNPRGEPSAIPKRPRHLAIRRSSIPPQPSTRKYTLRMVVATASATLVMLLLLMMAQKYLERDWQAKQRQARADRIVKPGPKPAPPPVETALPGHPHRYTPGAGARYLRSLSADALHPNHWLILGRSAADPRFPRLGMAGLRMAMAFRGETAVIKNDMGAALLQQRRTRQAERQFRSALQIQPGFPPALFNLALCEMTQRRPAKASALLAQYLAQRPSDTAAYRLQVSLLTQFDRPADALQLLEQFLKTQTADHPLYLEAAVLAARLNQHGNAIRYLEIAANGNPIATVIRTYNSAAFRDIRFSDDGPPLAARLARKGRAAYGTPLPPGEIQPLRAPAP